ncbi:uncharacterized protein [Haliotis asinina]|uniref:uncharacterized protein n=1 Tax=Haliotis asinina TaxID=109174 RepID=UPI0035318669
MDLHIGVLVFLVVLLCIANAGRIKHHVPGSDLTLTFEWEDPQLPPTEADYYHMRDGAGFRPKRATGGRPGHSTSTNTCSNIRGVPVQLRSASNIRPSGLAYFYQKYTEAYGIPVLGSVNVPDDALRRACYVLRFLLADHSGVRQSYYRLSGRVAVIGAREGTVSIPEHAWLGPAWNDRARGLGATEHAPVSTGGEENILCYTGDRYRDEDIFLHEFAHGIHLLGAKYAIPGWQSRLQSLYDQAKSAGRWRNTYAITTVEEYFAEGTQSYFNVNAYSAVPNGIHNDVNTRERLRPYDPQLYSLIQEVFPCGNTYLKRCNTSRDAERNQQLKMNCNQSDGGDTDSGSGTGSESGAGSASGSGSGSGSETGSGTCQDNNSKCRSWASQGECGSNLGYMHVHCRRSCSKCGADGTGSGSGTDTGTCQDNNANCKSWAARGECDANPAYMHVQCKQSCNKCEGASCADTNVYCSSWAKSGECGRNPAYMLSSCRRSCGQC